jgi:glucose/mannose transport system substrate-binding protein
MLQPLDALRDAQGWGIAMPAPLLQSLSRDSHLFGVPLDVERDNTLFYNKSVFASAGVPAPATFADVMASAAALKARGVTPFEVSASGGWTIASLLFDSVLVAQSGAAYYQAYLTGQKTADTAEIRAALSTVATMMDNSNMDRPTTGWGAAVAQVCKGQAAMLILPDFVKDEFASLGCDSATIDYVAMQPTGEPTFVFVGSAFVLTAQAAHPDAANEFLAALGGTAEEEALNSNMGTIPPRSDASATLDPIEQRTLVDFRTAGAQLVPGYSAIAPDAFQVALTAPLQAFADWTSGSYKDVDSVIAALTANYALLKQ